MAAITSSLRYNVNQLLHRPISYNKLTKSSSSKFASAIESVDLMNAKNKFYDKPCQTNHAIALFKANACEILPEPLRNAVLNEKGNAIRNMLGIIYREVEPQDNATFEKVFNEVVKNNNNFNEEENLSPELSYLFSKYGHNVLNRNASDYTQDCRKAWAHNHDGVDKNTTDEDIFSSEIMSCYDILNDRIGRLTQANQTWSSVYASGLCFASTCVAISKTLQRHGKPSSPELPAKNTPQNNTPLMSETYQPDMKTPISPDVYIPAENGHSPIIINNSAHGGHGGLGGSGGNVTIVNGNPTERAPTSGIDFGIALLNTPDEQLGNQKIRLIEKFMDLYWGRAQNCGQDKFSDYVDSVVQSTLAQTVNTSTLPSPRVLHAVDTLVSMPAPQSATITDSVPQPIIEYTEDTVVEQQITSIEKNNNVEQSNHSVALSPTDGKNLQRAVMQVAQALSGLMVEAAPSLKSQNTLQNKSSELTNAESSQLKQAQQPAMMAQIGPTTNNRVQQLVQKFETLGNVMQGNQPVSLAPTDGENLQHAATQVAQALSGLMAEAAPSLKSQIGPQKNVSSTNNQVQQLFRKFEKLNVEHQMRNESTANISFLETNNTVNSTLQSMVSNPEKPSFQPLKRVSNKFKFDASVNPKPVYRANRVIDPFSRHSADLKHRSNSFNQEAEPENILLNGDLVSSL